MSSTATHTETPVSVIDEQQFHVIKQHLKDNRGKTYAEFKKTLTPYYAMVWRDIFIGWAILCLIFVFAAWILPQQSLLLNICVCLITAILAGYTIAFLINFFHEAAHFNIAKNKNWNDRLANIFLGIFIGQGIKNYRPVHWQHHTNLGLTDDPERSYFESLNWKFFVRSLIGISAFAILRTRNTFINDRLQTNARTLKRERYIQLAAAIGFHSFVLAIFFLVHRYGLIFAWIAAVGCFYPFFNRLRQLIEHRSEYAGSTDYTKIPHGKHTRIFGNTFLDKSFGSAGFNKHLLHHLEPSISYTRLGELEQFFKTTELGKQVSANRTSYPKAFKKLLSK